jgi:probable selenium-dependent hydroxylase accessory protein YqeC
VNLARSLGLAGCRCVHLVGAGGKTTAMDRLADELAAAGRRVLRTTSTRLLLPPVAGRAALTFRVEEDVERLIDRLGGAWPTPHVTAGRAIDPAAGKLLGYSPAALDRIVASGVADVVLVEADGAAGRPLKAHRSGEPVFARSADRVLAVVGLSGLGQPLDAAFVHRVQLAIEQLGVGQGTPMGPELVARLLLGRGGWLDRCPTGLPVAVLLAGAASAEADVDVLEATLAASDRVERVVRWDRVAPAATRTPPDGLHPV